MVLFSPDAKKSRWVNAELEYAEQQGLTPFPILARGSTKDAVPFGYTSTQWADISSAVNYDKEMNDLVVAIRDDLRAKPLAPPQPEQEGTTYARPPSMVDFKDIIQRQRISPYFSRLASISSTGIGVGATPMPKLSFWDNLWLDVRDFILPGSQALSSGCHCSCRCWPFLPAGCPLPPMNCVFPMSRTRRSLPRNSE